MPRDNWIRLSDEEYDALTELKQTMFDTDEVSYGAVVGRLADEYGDR